MARKTSPSSKGSKGKYHVEMSTLSLFFWVFCLCFLLAWVFVLGVLVGRGFLPNAVSTISDLRTQINRLQGLVSHGKASTPDPPKIENDPKLAFYEKLSNKKEEVKKKPPHDEKTKSESAAKGSAERREQLSVAASGPVEKPKSSNGSGQGAQFTVQVASLEDKEKAAAMVGRLKDRGFDAYSYEVRINGKTFYRIRCGRFKTKEEAGNHAKKLAGQAGINGIVSRFE